MSGIKIYDVRAHSGDSAFLIDDGKTAIMYDSGYGFTGYAVAANIKAILGERSLDYIFLTHSHYDHALGSVYALKYWPDAKVVAGEYATKIFSKPTAKALMRELDGKFAKACGVSEYEDLVDNLKVDIPVCDGDLIRAGTMEFIAVELPGHTKCSIGYYCAKDKLLLGCETIGVFDGKDRVLPAYLVGYKMALDSIEKTKRLDVERILVPHYGLLSGNNAKLYISKAKESAVEFANNIKKKLENNLAKEQLVKEFLDEVYHGYIKEIYPIDAIVLNTNIMIDLLKKELEIKSQL